MHNQLMTSVCRLFVIAVLLSSHLHSFKDLFQNLFYSLLIKVIFDADNFSS